MAAGVRNLLVRREENLPLLDEVTQLEYIESSKAIRANRTIVCYGTFKYFLQDFEKDAKYKVDLHSINYKFFDNLRTYAFINRKAKEPLLKRIRPRSSP